jgi:ubiquinone/menaquinone biosynthesis C-methylase UbiE
MSAVTSQIPHDRSSAFAAASVPGNYERRLAPVVFEPWAQVLVDTVGVAAGDNVLDVASGTGVIARLAAQRAAPDGRVVATDVSEAMLAFAATCPVSPDAAAITQAGASADDLPFPPATFDVVLCQQGLQFFPDRTAAVREMRRVVRPGGVVGAAVWAAGHRLEPFDHYAEALAAAGAAPPFPGAFENATFVMGADDVRALLEAADFASVEVSTVELAIVWPDADSAAGGILGTPFGPLVDSLPGDSRAALHADLLQRFAPESPGVAIRRMTTSVIARATAPS